MAHGRYGNKRSHHRAFGAIAAARFYGGPSANKKPMFSKKSSRKPTLRVKRVSAGTTRRGASSNSVNDSYGGGAVSYARMIFGPAKTPLATKLAAPLLIHSNQIVVGSAAIGTQLILSPTASATRSSLQSWEGVIENNHKVQVGVAAAAPTVFVNTKVFLKYITQEHRIMNMSVRPVQIEIYDYTYKQSNGDTITQTLNNGSSADNTGDYNVAPWQNSAITLPGWRPTDSSVINQYIRIVKRKKVWLQAGESHIHVVSARYNKAWNPGFTGTSVQMLNYKGFTFGTFVIAMGSLSTGTTSGVNIDIGTCELGIYTIERASIRSQTTGLPQTQQYKGLNALTGVEKFVDEVVGGVFQDGLGIIAGAKAL